MCLAMPAQIVEVGRTSVSVKYGRETDARRAVVTLPPGLAMRAGDWILVYGGVVLSVIPEGDVEVLLELNGELWERRRHDLLDPDGGRCRDTCP